MKKSICIVLAAIMVLVVLSGCQSTPGKPIVQKKNIDRVLEQAQSTQDNTKAGETLREKLKIPETYTTSLKDAKGKLQVTVKADVILPNADKLPTAKVGMGTFSQETADKLMKLLLHGQTLYEPDSYLQFTKADIQKRLVELYAMRAGTIPVEVDSGDLEGSIKLWEKRLAEAPESVQKKPSSTTFQKRDMSDFQKNSASGSTTLEPYNYIEGITEINGKSAYFTIQNQTQENRIYALFTNSSENPDLMGGAFQPVGTDKDLSKPNISMEQAQAQTDTFIHELGLAHMAHVATVLGVKMGGVTTEVGKAQTQQMKSAYIVRYEREINGVPITYTKSSGTASEDSYAKSWPYEAITFVIDDTGIIEFYWSSPYTEPEVVTDSTKLLTFPQIQQVFEKMIIVKNSSNDDNTTAVQIDIDTAQLGLMRIIDPDQQNTGILIPVWDFFGTITYKNEKKQWSNPLDSVLTINAVDGTIIDRSVGY